MNLKKLFYSSIIFMFVIMGCQKNQPLPASEYNSLTNDGVWCWFSDPRAIYHKGAKECTYAGWVSEQGDIVIGSYNHTSKKIDTFVLHEKLEKDDHNVPSILVRDDGRILAFYSRHSDDDMYMRISTNPEDISQWEPVSRMYINDVDAFPKGTKNSYTYSNPYQLSQEDGRIYLFYRGMDFKPNVSISDDGGLTWSMAKLFILPERIYKNRRPYVKYYSDYKSKVHFLFTDGHPRNEPTNSVYYACYHDGAFYKANGEKMIDFENIPFSPQQADRVYDARQDSVRAWVWDVTVDSDDRPVIVYTRFPKETDHRYHYARWDGQKWQDHEITPAGPWFPQTPEGKEERETYYSGGVVLDHENPNVVYLSRKINGVFEIERWVTDDMGNSWTHAAITRNSQYDNVRPFVPWFSPEDVEPHVFWMTNLKYIHYSDYSSEIKMF